MGATATDNYGFKYYVYRQLRWDLTYNENLELLDTVLAGQSIITDESTVPTADLAGRMMYVEPVTGGSTLKLCMRQVDNSYSWQEIFRNE